jgi:hypothetical protein
VIVTSIQTLNFSMDVNVKIEENGKAQYGHYQPIKPHD